MPIGQDKVPRLVSLVGQDWLEDGSARLAKVWHRQANSTVIDLAEERVHHPLHILWRKHVKGESLLADTIGVSNLVPGLRQAHRLVTVDRLIAHLEDDWTESVRSEVRRKLRNRKDFASTVYELRVGLNLRRAGYDFRFLPAGSGKATPDIAGRVADTDIFVECKRATLEAKLHSARRGELHDLARRILPALAGRVADTDIFVECKRATLEAKLHSARRGELHDLARRILPALRDRGRCVLLEIDIRRGVHLDDIAKKVSTLADIPTSQRESAPGSWSVRGAVYDGDEKISPVELDGYDAVFVDGRFSGSDGPLEFAAVAVRDALQADLGSVVRKRLQRAIRQLSKGECNLVFLEVEGMANSDDGNETELDLVLDATRRFLAEDTTRVSAVAITSSGVNRTTVDASLRAGRPVRFRSAGKMWLVKNPRAEVPVPPGFGRHSFRYPDIEIEGHSHETDQPGVKRLVTRTKEF